MKQVEINIKAIDKTINYDKVNRVYIFTPKYKKKINKNEVHNPGAARLIIELENKIVNLFFMDLIILTNENGKIIVRSMDSWDKITQKKPYYNISDLRKAKQIFTIYKAKGLENLDPEEIFEYSWAKQIVETLRVKTLKIPFHIGGGF